MKTGQRKVPDTVNQTMEDRKQIIFNMDQQVICCPLRFTCVQDAAVPLQLLLGLLGNAPPQRCLTTLITAARETKDVNACKKKVKHTLSL